jgi:hypothetical protein
MTRTFGRVGDSPRVACHHCVTTRRPGEFWSFSHDPAVSHWAKSYRGFRAPLDLEVDAGTELTKRATDLKRVTRMSDGLQVLAE